MGLTQIVGNYDNQENPIMNEDAVENKPTPEIVDSFLDAWLPEDFALQRVRQNCRNNGLPEIEVSPQQGRLLEMLVKMSLAKRILEVGTLGAYSTICLSRGAGRAGTVFTIEYEQKHIDIAQQNIQIARPLAPIVCLRGAALDVLPTLKSEAPFDFVFIDADKENNAAYLDWAVKLCRIGATIVVDNVIRDGRVLATDRPEKAEFIRFVSTHPYLAATVVQTVGAKGWDGFVLARKI